MAIKETDMDYGLKTWAKWRRDCETLYTELIFVSPSHIEFELEIGAKLGEAIEAVAGFLGKKEAADAVAKVKPLIPQARVKITLDFVPGTGSSPCVNGRQAVHYGLGLDITITVLASAGGVTAGAVIRDHEWLDQHYEACDCAEKKSTAMIQGFPREMLAAIAVPVQTSGHPMKTELVIARPLQLEALPAESLSAETTNAPSAPLRPKKRRTHR